VNEHKPLIGYLQYADDGSDEGVNMMLVNRGVDRRRPPPGEPFAVGSSYPGGIEFTARSQLSLPVQHVTLVDPEGTCDLPILRALEVYVVFDEGDEAAPRRYIALLLPSAGRQRCGGDIAVAGATVRVRSLDGPLPPVPARLRPILARSDREAAEDWRSEGGSLPSRNVPGALPLPSHGLVYLRGTYENELLLRGTRIVHQTELGNSEFVAIAEVGPRMFAFMTTSGDDWVFDVETNRGVDSE
jgi:hypothetical protein